MLSIAFHATLVGVQACPDNNEGSQKAHTGPKRKFYLVILSDYKIFVPSVAPQCSCTVWPDLKLGEGVSRIFQPHPKPQTHFMLTIIIMVVKSN